MSVQVDAQGRLARLVEDLCARELDALLVVGLVDLRYLTGFTGSHGLALISSQRGDPPAIADHWFLTDFRYDTQSAEQVGAQLRREIVADDLLAALARMLAAEGRGGRLGFDEQSLTVAQHTRLGELVGDAWELVRAGMPCGGCARSRTRGRSSASAQPAGPADDALQAVLEAGLVGRSEREVAIELERRMRLLGADSPSFPSIVAAGAHAALPHAEPRA